MYNRTQANIYSSTCPILMKMTSHTHTPCPFCSFWTENTQRFCSNASCPCAKSNWNTSDNILLKNPVTGQDAVLSEFGKFPKAFAMGFTKLRPVPPPPPPATVTVTTTYVTGYVPVTSGYVLVRNGFY